MGYDGLDTDASMLRDYAVKDAKSQLEDEQVSYWQCGHPLGEPLKDQPRRSDLRNWLDENPSENEWRIYSQAFAAAMKAGIKVCDDVDLEDPAFEDDLHHEGNILEDACTAAERAVERLGR